MKTTGTIPDDPSLQLAELFNFLEDAQVWIKDGAGRYCWVNRAFLLNYELDHPGNRGHGGPARVVGKTDYDLSPAFLADQFRLDDEYVLAGNRILNRIELVGAIDGEAFWHVTHKIPMFDRDGRIAGTAGLSRRLSAASEDSVAEGFGPVLAHVRNHYLQPVTNQQLARLVNMSVRAFERKFLATFHLTPQKYLRKLRLRRASRALVFTQKAVAEIALECGFADQSHFTREFRRQLGQTPRDFREHYAPA